MVIPVPSNKSRFTVKLNIRALYPLVISIVAFDPARKNSHYLRRRLSFKGSHFRKGQTLRNIQIPMPVSPETLVISLKDSRTGDDDGFEIEQFTVEKMAPARVWATPERHRYMDFAIKFAENAGYVRAGFYNSPNHEFLIQYLPVITNREGEELVTPARIHQKMPRVQLSRKLFTAFSIPVRVAILAHEGCHFFRDTRSEKLADLCGIKYYLDYGFPTIEAVYAATKVFSRHPQTIGRPHLDRTRDIMDFIDQYKQKQKLEKIA